MIGLASRLAVSGGRENVLRLVLTALGVAIGTTLLLVAAAVEPAIRAQQRHTAWQDTQANPSALEGDNAPLLWNVSDDAVDGRPMTVLRVAATGSDSPVPVGLGHVPRPGEVYVSPALARLLDDLPADRLADRFPSVPSGTIGDDYLAGPDDLVAVVGVSEDEIEGLDPVEVHHVSTRPMPYQFSDFIRIVLGIGAVGLLMPVVALVSTSTRIGAARREQRFAALRLAGATPRQTMVVAAVEAAAAAVVGALLGWWAFVLLRPAVAGVELDGHESFVHDVHVHPAVLGMVLVGVPMLAVVAAIASLRRLQISPLGVARRAVRPRPTARRLVPLVVGTAGFVVSLVAAVRGGTDGVPRVAVTATFGVMIYGIVAAGPWFTVLAANALGRTGQRASVLLAGRRLQDDPAAGFRAVSGLVVAVFVASVFSGVTPALLDDAVTGSGGLAQPTSIVTGLPSGTSRATATAALDAAGAAGARRGVVLLDDPDAAYRGDMVLAACTDLDILGVTGPCPAGGTAWVDTRENDLPVGPAPYTAAEAADLPPRLVVVETDGQPATTDRVRTAIQQVVPGTAPWLGAEAEANHQLTQLNRIANLGLTLTLAIAGCSLAVAVAAGIVERKRPFALLRLAGMHLAELQRTALLEAAAPLLLITLACAVLGLGTSALIVAVAGGVPWEPPTIGYWASLAGGLVTALGVAAATLPLLGRTTAPSAVRFE